VPERFESHERRDYVRVGRIVAPHGIRGEVRVFPVTDFPEARFRPGQILYLATPQDFAERTPIQERVRMRDEENCFCVEEDIETEGFVFCPLEVVRARASGSVCLLAFRGVGDRNAAEALRGLDLYVLRVERPPLPEGTYYVDEVVGLRVIDEAGREIGRVSDVLLYAANDVWVVRRPGKRDLLLPFVSEFVREVSLPEGVVRVRLLPGLPGLEDEEEQGS